MADLYTTTGSVRGDCGHRHRTLTGAVRCLRDDQVGCARQGGCSDREVVYADGERLSDRDYQEVDSLIEEVAS